MLLMPPSKSPPMPLELEVGVGFITVVDCIMFRPIKSGCCGVVEDVNAVKDCV